MDRIKEIAECDNNMHYKMLKNREELCMNEDQFSAILAIIVPTILEHITKNSNVDDEKAISLFYRSNLYEEFSNESSKLWHYGPMTLYTLYQDELLTGSYDYLEES